MSPVSPVIDKFTFLTPAATNYHIIGLTGISFEALTQIKQGISELRLSGHAVMEPLARAGKIDMGETKHLERGGGVIRSHN